VPKLEAIVNGELTKMK